MDKPFFVDVMNKEQKLKFIGMMILWLVALIWFWSWWLQQDHFVSVWGVASNTIVISTIFAWQLKCLPLDTVMHTKLSQ